MLSMTAGFTTEKNKKTGASPVWILKCPFVAGTLYLSDRVFTYTGITIKPWIASWGSIDEDISNSLTMPMVSDFSVSIIIDPDAATDIHDLLWSESVETIDCELYLWFEGLTVATDPMIKVWTGNIIDFERLSELVYQVDLVDQSVKSDKYPGRVLSLADYPDASLNDVGYQMPIVYGSVEKVPGLRVMMGGFATLSESITALDITFAVSDVSSFAVGDKITIDGEAAVISGIAGNDISCWRGYDSDLTGTGTDIDGAVTQWSGICAAPNGDVYAVGSQKIYKQTGGTGAFVDLSQASVAYTRICAAPNGNIYACVNGGDIYKQTNGAGDFESLSQTSRQWWGITASPNGSVYACDATGDIYKQTNGAGDFEPLSQTPRTWYGLAAAPNGDVYAIVVGGCIYKQTDGTGDFDLEYNNANQWVHLYVAPNGDVYAGFNAAGDFFYKQTGGTGTFVEGTVDCEDVAGICISAAGNFYFCHTVSALSTKIKMLAGSAVIHNSGVPIQQTDIDCVFMFADHPVKSIDTVYLIDNNGVQTDITAAAHKYTGQGGANDLAGYAGKAVVAYEVDFTVGDTLAISGQGYQDGGAALIERPDLVIEHFLYTYAGWPTADFIHADAATALAADGYLFSVVINARKKLREWLAIMALQCRCWFRFANSKAYLLYRTDSLTSDKTVTAAMIGMNDDNTTTLRIKRSPLDEVVNVIHLYYKRDWIASGREAYQAIIKVQDATSIAAYGEKEDADTFLFDFVRDATMADDLADFYLARYKDRKKIVSSTVFLDNCEIEFADAVTFAALGNLLCEVRKIGLAPGNAGTNDRIALIAREY